MENKNFSSVKASSSAPVACERLIKHIKEIENRVFAILPASSFRDFIDHLPHLYWEAPKEIPGAFSVTLICQGAKAKKIRSFFSEFLTKWLFPHRLQKVLSCNTLDFHFEGHEEQTFTFIDLTLEIEHQIDATLALENMPRLRDDLLRGIIDDNYAQHILEAKGMSLEEKSAAIQKRLAFMAERFPSTFDKDLFAEAGHLMLHLSENFKSIRNVKHLCKIALSHYYFRSLLRQYSDTKKDKRHIRIKLFKTQLRFPFGNKQVLGIAICINMLSRNEVFDDQHINKAVNRLLPGIKMVSESFITYHNDDSIRNLYIEFEKLNGQEFSQNEIQRFKKILPGELKASVEHLVNAVYMHHNEEEIYRNISVLSQEVRYLSDLPQLTVAYQEQDRFTLTFNVIMVRVKKKGELSLEEAIEKNPLPKVKFFLQFKKVIGMIRKKHPKEAYVFQIKFEKSKFLRHDYAIDLYQARQFVVKMLEVLIGPIRDYNGGWLIKQFEVLSKAKELIYQIKGLEKKDRLIETFFYAIRPAVMRTLLSPEVIQKLFNMLHKLLDQKIQTPYQHLLISDSSETICLLMIKADSEHFEMLLEEAVNHLSLDSNHFAKVSLNVYGSYYLGYYIKGLNQDQANAFISNAKKSMHQWSERQRKQQALRIHINTPASLDPRIGMDRTSGIMIKMLFEGLMRIGLEGTPEFGIAKSYEISSDRKTYTFKLRDSQWTNGQQVVAEDFEYAWKKILEPNFSNVFVYLLFPIKNAKAIKQGKCSVEKLGVKSVDSKTLVVELEHPCPYFLKHTAHWAYSPLYRDIDRTHPDWSQFGSDKFVCNGPFKMAKWKEDRGFYLVKNHGYWDAKQVQLEGVNISVVDNPSISKQMFQKGQIDWLGEPLLDFPQNLSHDKEVIVKPTSAISWFQFNTERFPFNNLKMRQAFGLAIKRAELVQSLKLTSISPALSVIPPSYALHKDPIIPDGNREEAVALFKEGLQEVNLSTHQLPPITLTHSSRETEVLIAKEIQKQWQNTFGIPVILECIDSHIYLKESLRYNFQIRIALWYSWYEDPIYNLEYLKYRDDPMNMTNWEHPDFIHYLNQADNELDPKCRLELLRKAEKLLVHETPVVPLIVYSIRYKKKEELKNIFISNMGQIDFKWAFVAKR